MAVMYGHRDFVIRSMSTTTTTLSISRSPVPGLDVHSSHWYRQAGTKWLLFLPEKVVCSSYPVAGTYRTDKFN